jgi:hypothetical protein
VLQNILFLLNCLYHIFIYNKNIIYKENKINYFIITFRYFNFAPAKMDLVFEYKLNY